MGRKLDLAHLSPDSWADALEQARKLRPLVYTITNFVSASFQADGTIAAGGSPVMSRCPEEAEELAATASSLVINMGTPDEAGLRAVKLAMAAGRNIVFDPVGYGATSFRKAAVEGLLSVAPLSVIKGNYGEIQLLAGGKGIVHGVDTGTETAPLASSMIGLARKTGSVVCATGAEDLVADSTGALSFSGGSPLMAGISGGGCLLGSLMGVFIPGGVARGVCAAVVMLRLAAERAAGKARGPGSFRSLLIDEISRVCPEDMLSQGWRAAEMQKGGSAG